MNEVQRCAECDCDNGGDECNWIATPKPTVVGYMCKTDYEWELGYAAGGTDVYSSVKDLKKNKGCTQGIVMVRVQLMGVVQEEVVDNEG